MIEIRCRPIRNSWLEALYENNLIEASEKTRKYSDKLFLYQELHSAVGDVIHNYHPKTLGLNAFFEKYNLPLSPAPNDLELITKALKTEFPAEVILKPTTVMNTAGENGTYLFSTQSILRALTTNGEIRNSLGNKNYVSELIGVIASGEEFILQEHIASIARMPVVEKTKHYQEVRIHTYENAVLLGASYSRWEDNEIKMNAMFYWAQDFIQEFLNVLPPELLIGQAWSLDVLVFENRTLRLLEINTNRGSKGQWSGFLSRPELLGAYTRHLEQKKQVRFLGFSGFLLRKNLGNITKHLKKKYIEGIR